MKSLSLALLATPAVAIPYFSYPLATQKYLISFGDSYTSTSFNITGAKPSSSNPLGNPPYPGWTSAGGANWISNLVATYNDSLLLNYNLAYGGATVNASLVAPYTPEVYSFIDQVEEFTEYLAPKPAFAPWTANSTLFAVWMGVNDVGGSWYQANPDALQTEILDQLFEQIEIVYDGGARNFALLTVPPTERTPQITQGENANYTITHLSAAIESWNTGLNERASDFAAAHSDAVVKITDTQPVFNQLLDAGGESADCWNEDGVTCLWFNDYHPGLVIQDAVAQAVAADWEGFFVSG
ncbi:SGNH/GDSL hydrolase family protein [Aspergillus undulatus]|uniref:SGNH/GDSL hydrolase family protein n=1 Tax=Aspergillus undulatus TaxID=1810928 RepID=UPI003CCD2681